MKRINWAVVLLSVGFLMGCSQGRSESGTEAKIPTIHVKGQGHVETLPDEAVTSFGVSSESKSLEKAYRDNTGKINAVIQTLKAAGVADKDIKTSSYSVHPIYAKDEKGRTLTGFPVGFRVRQQLTVLIRDLSTVGDLIDQVMAGGINVFNGIQFTSSRTEELEKEAKMKAAKDAEENAALLAKSLDVRLGRLLKVSDELIQPFRPNAMRMMARAGAEMSAVPQIQAGSMEISATCSVEYEILQ